VKIGFVICAATLAASTGFAAAPPDFAREIRPILERSCFGCHGPEKQKSGYRLDVRDIALKGGDSGKAAIIPHDAKASPLMRFVSGEDPEVVMPPPKSNAPRLSAAEIQALRDWINAGPAWPETLAGNNGDTKPHWSLAPLVKPVVPVVNEPPPGPSHASKARSRKPDPKPAESSNPIDAFIRAKLAEKNLTPSPEADRRTLIRRVAFDLTGLPPTPEEAAAFVTDPDPLAYERLVARLLDSPRYGERWARHWFDTIHFADSHGYEHDIGREYAWRFRDYVIAALNQDTPWARFIREQLAADVFFPEQPRLRPALGFLGAGTFDLSTYSTAPVTFDYLDRDDLVTQTMAAFVSTTANCARCHAHKFDPISQEDYYALQAVFSGVLKGDMPYDEDNAVARERRRLKSLLTAAAKQDTSVLLASEHAPTVEAWLQKQGPGVRWEALEIETFLSAEGATLSRTTNGTLLSGGTRPDKDTYTITATTSLSNITALRLDVLSHESLPKRGPGRNDNGNLHLSEIELRVFGSGSTNSAPVKFRRATADFNQTDWGIERAMDGDPKTAWGIFPAVGQSHHAVFEFAEPLAIKPGARLAIVLKQAHGGGHLIGAFNLGVTSENPTNAVARPLEVEAALAISAAQRSESNRVALATHALQLAANEALAKLPTPSYVYAAAPSVNIVDGNPSGLARSLAEPKVVNILHRGEFDQPREAVTPGALSALTHLPARWTLKDPKDESARRAALADWLAHPDNVLTWRSIVNRVWHYHFGRGLCDTPSDFGRMGGKPSHPELLDWLAVWFREEARGSLKELHRLIVTSATYRQSSQHRPEAAQLDGDNRLLWRQNRQRLDADSFRDFTLAVSGALDLKMGGPAVQHFKQSKGPQLTPALDYSGYDWSQPGAGRRSIYRFAWRGIADPFMEALDFPDLGLLSPVRSFSASSLQALTLYNDDFVLHHSAVLAKRVQAETPSLPAQINRAAQLVWLREPDAAERGAFNRFARRHSLPALCRLLLNSNEFLFVE
jgi:mono/diheme cytochrome c family protein